MKPFVATLQRLLSIVTGPRRDRRGSVLIFAIVILLIMAIMGLAYLVTSRNDRSASAQNVTNTQLTLMLNGLADMVNGRIVGDVKTAATSHADNSWLADIVPVWDTFNSPIGVRWPSISGSLVNSVTASQASFESLQSYIGYASSANPPSTSRGNMTNAITGWSAGSKETVWVQPDYMTIGTVTYPALTVGTWDSTANKFAGPYSTYLAADADGDGIADAGLFRLPVPATNGITWYGAFRVVDNCAAFNVNIAWDNNNHWDDTKNVPQPVLARQGFFPTDIGLMGVDDTGVKDSIFVGNERTLNAASAWPTGMYNLNRYRFGVLSNSYQSIANPPRTSLSNGNAYSDPANQAPQARAELKYFSLEDALYHQLGRRINNPGYGYDPDGAKVFRFQSFPISESANLAYRYCLVNGNLSQTPLLENLLPNTLNSYAYPASSAYPNGVKVPRTNPYSPSDVTNWFRENFDYGNETNSPSSPIPTPPAFGDLSLGYLYPSTGQYRPLRSLMVTRNPVTNFIPTDIDPGDPINPGMMPWGLPGATVVHSKTNINTATFPELWRAFWCVMQVGRLSVPADPVKAAAPLNMLPPNWSDPNVLLSNGHITSTGPVAQVGQFRNSLRDTRTSGAATITVNGTSDIYDFPLAMTCCDMLQLRSAIAAINTVDLRDTDDDVSSRQFVLFKDTTSTIPQNPANPTGPTSVNPDYKPKFVATVFGYERQPFITEVMVDYSNSNTPRIYVVLELTNPYSVPISLKNYCLAYIDRDPNGSVVTDLKPKHIYTFPAVTIPAATTTKLGHTVIEAAYNSATGVNDAACPLLSTSGSRPSPAAANPGWFPTGNPVTAPSGTTYNIPGTTNTTSTALVANSTLLNANNPTAVPPTSLAQAMAPCNLHPSAPTNFKRELVLLRPRRSDGTLTKSTQLGNIYDEGATPTPNVADMVPVDMVDFSNVVQPTTGPMGLWSRYAYIRPCAPTSLPDQFAWQFVYPGPWDQTKPYMQLITTTVNISGLVHSFGVDNILQTPTILKPPTGMVTAPTFAPIQLSNIDWPGPNFVWPGPVPPVGTINNQFPFGTFARAGDLLKVTFIGSYRVNQFQNSYNGSIQATNIGPVIAMNSITMDAAMADNGYTSIQDDATEDIGRFCPQTTSTNQFSLKIETEDFDTGDSGKGGKHYYDNDATNNGKAYRPFEGVDIEKRDPIQGYNIGWAWLYEWLSYTVYLPAGSYTLKARVDNLGPGGYFIAEFRAGAGVISGGCPTNQIAGPVNIPGTGSWSVFTNTNAAPFTIPTSGIYTMKVVYKKVGSPGSMGNYDWFMINGVVSNGTGTPDYYDFGVNLLQYFTVGNPRDDYFPAANVDYADPVTPVKWANPRKYPNASTAFASPVPVSNSNFNQVPGTVNDQVVVVSGPTAGSFTVQGNNLVSTPDYYKNCVIGFTSGLLAGQYSTITGSAQTGATALGATLTVKAFPTVAANLPAPFSKPPADTAAAAPTLVPSVGDTFQIISTNEDYIPNDGLVNINTAPWYVLSRLPLLNNSGTNSKILRLQSEVNNLAKTIVYDRDVNRNGSFRNVMDLNRLQDSLNLFNRPQDTANIIAPATMGRVKATIFRNWYGDVMLSDYDRFVTDLAPDTANVDGVLNDFEERFHTINRISNLVTARSDSFTVYLVVQGWKNAGSTDPKNPPAMVSQRRMAYIIDRSNISSVNNIPRITFVPTYHPTDDRQQ